MIGLGQDSLGNRYQINVSPSLEASYKATMGHKIKHSFLKVKATYNWVSHPRFGRIRSVTAIDDIWPGEEIFLNYEYPIEKGAKVPQWYKNLYEKQIGRNWPQ